MGCKMDVSSTNTGLKMWSIDGCETANFIVLPMSKHLPLDER